jgi:hypothetical protein
MTLTSYEDVTKKYHTYPLSKKGVSQPQDVAAEAGWDGLGGDDVVSNPKMLLPNGR